jgi:hypothetical protein
MTDKVWALSSETYKAVNVVVWWTWPHRMQRQQVALACEIPDRPEEQRIHFDYT